MKLGRITAHHHGLVRKFQLPDAVRGHDFLIADRLDGQLGEVDIGDFERLPLVQACQQQQVLHERGHPLGLALHTGEGPLAVGGEMLGHPHQLRVAADGRQRRAEFVRGVGDKLPDLHLALLPRLESVGDVIQHLVQRVAHAAHFRSGMGRRRRDADPERHLAGVQRETGDLGGDLGELFQRLHGPPDQGSSGEPDQHEPACGHDHHGPDQGGQGVLFFCQRESGHDHVAVRCARGREPVGAGRKDAVHGHAARGEGQEGLVVGGGEVLDRAVPGQESGPADFAVHYPCVKRPDALSPGLEGVGAPARIVRGRPAELARTVRGLVQLGLELPGEEEVHGGVAKQAHSAADGHEQRHGDQDQPGAQMPRRRVAPVASGDAGHAGK